MARTARKTPAELAPAPWPDGRAEEPIAEVARLFVLNVRAAMDGQSLRGLAGESGLHHTTLSAVMAGRVWPDLETIAKIERALDVDVWPGRVG